MSKANGIAASNSELDVNNLNNNDSNEPQRKFLFKFQYICNIFFLSNLYLFICICLDTQNKLVVLQYQNINCNFEK